MHSSFLKKALIALPIFVSGIAMPAYSASIKLTFSDVFNGNVKLPLSDTRVFVFNLNGQRLLETAYSDAAGNITLPTINIATQNVFLVPVPKSDAVNFNPDPGCLSGIINQIARSTANIYPAAKQVLSTNLKTGTTTLNVDEGRAVFALQALNKSHALARDYLGITLPKVTVLWKPCALLSCGGADACFVSGNLGEFGDYSSVVPNNIKIFANNFSSKGWLDYVTGHEYGHYLHYKMQNGHWPFTTGPAPHYRESVSNGGFAWKEGFAEFFGNYVAQSISGVYDPQGFEFFPQWTPGSRSTSNEGHVAAFLWDLFNADYDYANSGNGDELYNQPHWGAFRQVMQSHATSINNVTDFYNKYQQTFGFSHIVESIWNANMSTGWGRSVVNQNFDCIVGSDCAAGNLSTHGFWNILNTVREQAGSNGSVLNMRMVTGRTGSGYTGTASMPWLWDLGYTRNAPGGLNAQYEMTFMSNLDWTRSTFSLMQGVNDFWPAIVFSINPGNSAANPKTIGILVRNYDGSIVSSTYVPVDPNRFVSKTIIARMALGPTWGTGNMQFQVLDKATNAVIATANLANKNMGMFSGMRFDHELPPYPISWDNIVVSQAN
jgi:hypothetical protein